MFKTTYNRYKYYWILTVSIVLMTSVSGICNQMRVFETLVLAAFQLFCLLLPGIAIMILIPIRNLKGIERLLLAYTFGYVLTMLIYSIVMIVGGKRFVRISFILIAILAIGIIYFKGKEIEPEEDANEKIWIFSILGVFFVSLAVFSLRWKAPYSAGENYYETDLLYWAGDIVSLTKKVPPVNFRTLVNNYRYHYFGALQQAVVSSVTGISVMKTATCYSYIEASIFMGLSSYALVNRVIKNNKVKAVTLLLMLFSTGYEMFAGTTYIWHIYLLPMSYNIAQSLGQVVVLLLLVQLKNKKVDVRNLIAGLCCLICCAGTKSATGAVIFCSFFVCYSYLLLRQKSKKTAYSVLFGAILIFGAIGVYLWPTVKAYDIALRLPVMDGGKWRFLYSSIDWIADYMKNVIGLNLWTFIPAICFISYSVIHKNIKKEYILFTIIIVIGTAANFTISFYGASQMYFAFIAFPFAALLTGCCIEKIFSKNISDRVQLVIVGIVSIAVIFTTIRGDYKGYFLKYLVTGFKNLDTPNVAEEGDDILPVSYAECSAYLWINANTDEDAMLLSDRRLQSSHDPAGIFSERYVYYFADDEDRENVRMCFEGEETALEMYSDSEIDYIVQTKRLSPGFHCPESIGERVFENEEVAVYGLFK